MEMKTKVGIINLHDALPDNGAFSSEERKKQYEKPQIIIEEYEMTNICSLSGGANSLFDGWDF